LGVFCYLFGLLVHPDDTCDKLFAIAANDGVRPWGPEIRVNVRRPGGGYGKSRWLRGEGESNSKWINNDSRAQYHKSL